MEGIKDKVSYGAMVLCGVVGSGGDVTIFFATVCCDGVG